VHRASAPGATGRGKLDKNAVELTAHGKFPINMEI
jgi:hypothetical protein